MAGRPRMPYIAPATPGYEGMQFAEPIEITPDAVEVGDTPDIPTVPSHTPVAEYATEESPNISSVTEATGSTEPTQGDDISRLHGIALEVIAAFGELPDKIAGAHSRMLDDRTKARKFTLVQFQGMQTIGASQTTLNFTIPGPSGDGVAWDITRFMLTQSTDTTPVEVAFAIYHVAKVGAGVVPAIDPGTGLWAESQVFTPYAETFSRHQVSVIGARDLLIAMTFASAPDTGTVYVLNGEAVQTTSDQLWSD